jgi:hypothetical protein
MGTIAQLSDAELLSRLPLLVSVERESTVDVVEHLVEVERRRLYLEQACSSLNKYCEERLLYDEDSASKRARAAKVALRFPRALEELRSRTMHLTSLVLLAPHLTEANAEVLFSEASGKSRREIELLLARRFPRPDVPPKIQPLTESPAANGSSAHSDTASGPHPQNLRSGAEPYRLEPLSAERYRIEFTASAEFREKLEQARELVSHSVPSGDIAQVLERALDELIRGELKRRTGAGKPRKSRKLQPGSRRIPVEVARAVRERDGDRCTFTDGEGRRCSERRFLAFEHCDPFALGGPATVENLRILCSAHNAHTARKVFGEAFIAEKRAQGRARSKAPEQRALAKPDLFTTVEFALCKMGFRERDVRKALAVLHRDEAGLELEPLLRAALGLLTPAMPSR